MRGQLCVAAKSLLLKPGEAEASSGHGVQGTNSPFILHASSSPVKAGLELLWVWQYEQ